MALPSNWFGLAVLVTLVLPGIVFTGARANLQGFRDVDRSVSGRVLQALIVSVVFDSIYVGCGWTLLSLQQLVVAGPAALASHAQLVALLVLVLGVVVPLIVSWVIYGRARQLQGARDWVTGRLDKLRGTGHASTPTAWDWAPDNVKQGWVRIRIAPGVWVGGKFGSWSFVSAYPEPRDIFIEEPWPVDADGNFGSERVPGGVGMWLAVKDDYVVIWVNGDVEE